MALNAGIIARAAPMPQAPEPIDYDPGRNALSASLVLKARQDAQDRAEAMRTNAAFQQALQQSGGDYDKAASMLESRGINALPLRESIAKSRKATLDAAAQQYDVVKKQHDALSGYAAQIHDQASLDKFRPLMVQTDPELEQQIPTVFDPAAFQGFAGLGETGNKILDRNKQALDAYNKGEFQSGFGRAVSGTLNDDDLKAAKDFARRIGTPESVIQQIAPDSMPWSPQLAARAATLSMSPKDLAEQRAKDAAFAEEQKQHGISNANEAKRIGLESARVGMERQRLGMEQAANTAAIAAANPNAPHGEEFLKTLPNDSMRAQVKALAEGRMAFPSGFALKSPYWQQMLQSVAQYDPGFDAINYNARAKMRADATSGKMGQANNAMNTAIGHLGQLADKVQQLNNFGGVLTPLNTPANFLSKLFGSEKVTNFETAREAVIDEATRVYRQAGGSEADIKARREQMNAANSPAQLYGAIQQTADLIRSKVEANQSQYEQGMGTSDIQMVQPKARATLQRLDQLTGHASTPADSSGYQVGQVVSVKGRQVKITKVLPNGQFEGVPVP